MSFTTVDQTSRAIYIVLSKGGSMSDGAYLLLDVAEGKTDQVSGKLGRVAGIRIVNVLEGQPGVIAVVEAPERYRLVEITIRVISSVETMTEDLQLLPARDGLGSHNNLEPSYRVRNQKGNSEYA